MRPAAQDEGARVARVDPADGAVGVFRDACVVVWLSHPADPGSLSAATLHVEDPAGLVPGRLDVSPDAHAVVWRGERPLTPGVPHFVVASGLRDARGREVSPHVSRFVPCDVGWRDLGG
ncbi:MAG: hypothetical protein HY317_05045 [Acidobacteria bacterium]|nr:hypothetical protein [Acidobacteriota bacterium]